MRGTLTINFDPPFVTFAPIGNQRIEGARHFTREELHLLLQVLGAEDGPTQDGVIRIERDFDSDFVLGLRLLPGRYA